MSAQAKYGWAIGLIVMGVVFALPFRHSESDDPQVVASKIPVREEDPVDDNLSTRAATSRASSLRDSDLLPDSGQKGKQADNKPRQFTPDESTPVTPDESTSGQGNVVGQVPNRFAPVESTAGQVINANPPSGLQPVEFSKERVIRKMPPEVGPYRMKPVRSKRFIRASQSNRSPVVSRPSSSQKVVHYKLRDGDSLRSIARRYLGDESRYRDILLDNRHVLTNGESFLPVGQFITIVLQ